MVQYVLVAQIFYIWRESHVMCLVHLRILEVTLIIKIDVYLRFILFEVLILDRRFSIRVFVANQ